MPTKYREILASDNNARLVMTAHTQDKCALIYPENEWLNIRPKIEALPTFNKVALRAQRLLIGYATNVEMDSNGRLLVPPTIREYAGLDKRMMLVGMGQKFELWDEGAWFATIDAQAADDEVPEEMKSLSL